MKYLIDTNILIDHFRGDKVATEFLLQVEEGRVQASVSVITEYELLVVPHMSPVQAREIKRLLGFMPRLAVTSRIARLAADFRRRYQTNIADALIAATAHARHATLITRNLKDFRLIQGLHLHSI